MTVGERANSVLSLIVGAFGVGAIIVCLRGKVSGLVFATVLISCAAVFSLWILPLTPAANSLGNTDIAHKNRIIQLFSWGQKAILIAYVLTAFGTVGVSLTWTNLPSIISASLDDGDTQRLKAGIWRAATSAEVAMSAGPVVGEIDGKGNARTYSVSQFLNAHADPEISVEKVAIAIAVLLSLVIILIHWMKMFAQILHQNASSTN